MQHAVIERDTVAEPDTTAALLARLQDLMQAGRIYAARTLLAALRKMQPHNPDLDIADAQLLLREGQDEAALTLLDRLIEDRPVHAQLLLLRADARLRGGNAAGAASDAAGAVIAAPADARAKATLGLTLTELGQPADAARCLREALAAMPENAAFRLGLAEALERSGDVEAAAAILAEGRRRDPGLAPLTTATMMLELRRGGFAEAIAAGEAAQRNGIADACIFGLLGHARSSTGEHESAAEAYLAAYRLAPDDPYVRHLVQASGAVAQAERAPLAYLQVVFDGYAERFEAHLISLGYRVPGLLRARLLAARGIDPANVGAATAAGAVLDLGCGTGLMGVALSDLPGMRLVGVDLSAKMIAHAWQKGIYADLAVDDIESYLQREPSPWNVILAGDVLSYFGALNGVIAAAAARLAPDGLLLFSVEDGDAVEIDSDWRIGRLGRYAHRRRHIAACAAAAGLTVREIHGEALRDEADKPVAGLICVLSRA
jgi:predicted TPR repeat methyltransferase